MHLCYEHRTAVQINNYSIERQIKIEQPVRWLIFGDTALKHPDVETVQGDVVTVRVDFSHLFYQYHHDQGLDQGHLYQVTVSISPHSTQTPGD